MNDLKKQSNKINRTESSSKASQRKRLFVTVFGPFDNDSIKVVFHCDLIDQIPDFWPFLTVFGHIQCVRKRS